MSDKDLVFDVAKKVMGFKHVPVNWQPLKSWDDAMSVVKEMRTKGFLFQFLDVLPETLEMFVSFDKPCEGRKNHVTITYISDEIQRRAILQAALKAVES